ncbi:amidase domain-containing protein [Litchfieldia alkalitelluris]|uniref:amidase domain-containing protein n=1 Tax=Litchfieldia alkalitelluris TaxID=304268 RepID=UPI0009971C46
MKDQLRELIHRRVQLYVGKDERNGISLGVEEASKIYKKKESYQKRNAEIIKCKAETKVLSQDEMEEEIHLDYLVHFQYLVKQKENIFLEEAYEERRARFRDNKMIDDRELIKSFSEADRIPIHSENDVVDRERVQYTYDRLAAVKYAERWWNDYNPEYKKFDVDCTNYISQCIHAGGVPMNGFTNRSKGWWMKNNNWSFSWSVANSMRWHLSGSKSGLQAKEVSGPEDLLLGDIICYDFEGDGKYNHTTIVVAKDYDGMPLVNAHTQNSRMRYWAYEDSTAYTPNIKYKFFSIIDVNS